MKYLLVYLLIINAAGFFLMLADKRRAKKNLWRVPEARLIALALFGGSMGVLGGMYAFHHKTRKGKFTVGIPLILLFQAGLAVLLVKT